MIITFGTGSGRCGTDTFGSQMQRLKGVVGVHEGLHRLSYRRVRPGSPMPPSAPHLVCGDSRARDWNIKALVRRRELYMQGPEQVGYGEGAHYMALNLDLVAEIFPEARIVHLVRNPIAQLWSMLQYGGGEVYGQAGSHPRQETHWKRWPDSFPIFPKATTRAEGFAYHWQAVNEAIEKSPLPTLLVRTEVLGEPETWEKILDFAGLDSVVTHPELVFNARSPKMKLRPMPPEVEATAKRICTWQPK